MGTVKRRQLRHIIYILVFRIYVISTYFLFVQEDYYKLTTSSSLKDQVDLRSEQTSFLWLKTYFCDFLFFSYATIFDSLLRNHSFSCNIKHKIELVIGHKIQTHVYTYTYPGVRVLTSIPARWRPTHSSRSS